MIGSTCTYLYGGIRGIKVTKPTIVPQKRDEIAKNVYAYDKPTSSQNIVFQFAPITRTRSN